MRGKIIALSAAFCVAAGAAAAQDKTFELRLSHWVPPSHPLQKALEDWGSSIEKASNGTIKYKIYPSQQLGKAFDHYDMARDGIADVTYVSPGYQPGRFPIIDAGNLPFLVSNAKEGSGALDEWYRKYAAKEMPDVHFCFAFLHDPGTFHSTKKKIVVPADIKGMKIRPAHATMASWITQLGGTNVQAAAPEVRDVLEKGVADAVTFPWGSIPLFGIDKVTKYHIDAPLYVSEQVWVLNKSKYDSLSPAQRQVMDQHCSNDWALKVATPWSEFEAGGRDKIKPQPGQEVYPLTAEELAAWRNSSAPVTATWEDSVRKANGDPKAIFDDLRKTLADHKSAY
jgi:TRAP-type C4-dicarboxylate transport system substrate-binding protein